MNKSFNVLFYFTVELPSAPTRDLRSCDASEVVRRSVEAQMKLEALQDPRTLPFRWDRNPQPSKKKKRVTTSKYHQLSENVEKREVPAKEKVNKQVKNKRKWKFHPYEPKG